MNQGIKLHPKFFSGMRVVIPISEKSLIFNKIKKGDNSISISYVTVESGH